MTQGICWIDGELLPLAKARLPVVDHGLLYGDGVFEGIRFYGGTPFLLPAHLDRLRRSARAIALDFPWSHSDITAIVKEVVAAFSQPQGYLRIIVTRGDGPLGIDPAPCRSPRLIVIADTLQMVDKAKRERGVDLIIASTRKVPNDSLDPRIKSLNYLNAIMARIEANRAGAEEAILLNGRGHVAEGTADNVFIVRDGMLLTPPVVDGALEGVTRGLIMELAAESNIGTRETSLTPYDLYTADECFLTGTGAELIPVRRIDGRLLPACPGPVFRTCQSAFENRIAS